MFCLRFIATGTILSLNSANKGRNRSKKGSRQVVPSGQNTRSPFWSNSLIRAASTSRSRVRAIAGVGDMNSESLVTLSETLLLPKP
ncbi:hypothetical protein Hdeb2414_s0015g00444001 [Helianthus debilis subsp. tardiflorus]